MSQGMAILVVEIALLKFGFFMLNASIPLLDLVAYCGYKYVG